MDLRVEHTDRLDTDCEDCCKPVRRPGRQLQCALLDFDADFKAADA